jgi:hypothetical protein
VKCCKSALVLTNITTGHNPERVQFTFYAVLSQFSQDYILIIHFSSITSVLSFHILLRPPNTFSSIFLIYTITATDQHILTLWWLTSTSIIVINSVPSSQKTYNASPFQESTGNCCFGKQSLFILRIIQNISTVLGKMQSFLMLK